MTSNTIETAVNIGYSCKLLTEPMKVFIINAETYEGVLQQLQEAKDTITETLQCIEDGRPITSDIKPTGPPFGIVVNGHSLVCVYVI